MRCTGYEMARYKGTQASHLYEKSFTCSGMTLLIYMGPTALRGIRATLSNVESQVFTPYKFGSTAGDRTPDLLTTRPTCYHSATALCL